MVGILTHQAQRQQIIAEYDEEIQKELASIKAVYEKKEQTEKNIREKLEKELTYCRTHHSQQSQQGTLGNKKAESTKKDLNADIKRMLDEKEAKILQLEKELIAVSWMQAFFMANLGPYFGPIPLSKK